MFEPDDEGNYPRVLAMTGLRGWIVAFILATISGLVHKYVGSVGGWWTILFWLMMLGCIYYTAWEFTCAGTEWLEWVPFMAAIVVMGIPFMAANVAVQKTVLASAGVFWKSVFDIVSWLLLLAAQVWMLWHLLCRREWYSWLTALCALALIAVLLLSVFGIEWGALSSGSEKAAVEATDSQPKQLVVVKETEPQATEPQETELKYVHDIVLVDDDPMNDFNFGPDAIWTVVNRKLADGKLTKEQVEDCKGDRAKLAKLVTADELLDELLESIHDPAGLAAFWASLSVRLHIPFADDAAMFSFDGEKNMDRTNAMAKVWDADPDRFEQDYKKLCKFLARIYSVEIREVKNISNQMYMWGFEVAELPDVVFYESDEDEAIVLVLTWAIKGEMVKLEYNTICDFQLIDGAEDFGVTPKPKPVNPNPPEPDPDPTPAPYSKDPTQGVPIGGEYHADSPGTDTNNGVGSTVSAADSGTNSGNMTATEYSEAMEELEEVSTGQQVGGNPNTPSTPTPTGANIDNNGDSGTGNDGIDEPTPTIPTEPEIATDPVGTEWGGPPD